MIVSYTSPESWCDRNHGFVFSHGRKHLIGEVFSWDFLVSNRYMVEGPPFLISKVPQEIPLLISCLPTCIEYREGLSNWLMIITEVSCTPHSRTRFTSVSSSELNLLKKCQLDVYRAATAGKAPPRPGFCRIKSSDNSWCGRHSGGLACHKLVVAALIQILYSSGACSSLSF